MQPPFTEQDTEQFYDLEDALYRSFWDKEGSLHWGFFDETTGTDFLQACANLNAIMADKARIGPESRVLDMGCGNGNTAKWLCQSRGSHVTGIDLSGVRIQNARDDLQRQPPEIQGRLAFEKASATSLPFEDRSFTHVWSQATIYHVHEKGKALQEVHRVLDRGGLLVFDDLTKPKPDISEAAQAHVYDRLLFDTDFSFQSYQDTLKDIGFQILEAHDLSEHLKTSYQCLARMTQEKAAEDSEKFHKLSHAYGQMVQAVENGELGWGMYVCQA